VCLDPTSGPLPAGSCVIGICRDPRVSGPAVGSYTERVSFDWSVPDRKRRPNWSVMIALGRRATRACGRPAPSGLGYDNILLRYLLTVYRSGFRVLVKKLSLSMPFLFIFRTTVPLLLYLILCTIMLVVTILLYPA
jgi:hypothetical protein